MITDFKHFDLFGRPTFSKAIVRPPFKMMASMENEACFFYLISGESGVVTSTENFPLQAEEGIVMQCGNYLNEYFVSADSQYSEAFAVHFHPEVLKTIYDKEFPDFLLEVDNVVPAGYEKRKGDSIMKSYVENLQFYFDNPELVSEELLKLKLKELILLLAKTDNAEQIRNLLSGLFTKSDLDFKQVIEVNIYNNLSVEELAFLMKQSLSTFKREFVKHYDTSPAKYIKIRKLEKACKLLSSTEQRISDVAYDCGFSDLAHFSKSFQKNYGTSPTAFRLNQKSQSLN